MTSQVKKMVVISQSLYKNLMKARGVRVNGQEKLVNDQVFKNLTQGNESLDQLRKDQEQRKNALKGHIGDDGVDEDDGMSQDDEDKADDDDDDADGGHSGWGN